MPKVDWLALYEKLKNKMSSEVDDREVEYLQGMLDTIYLERLTEDEKRVVREREK